MSSISPVAPAPNSNLSGEFNTLKAPGFVSALFDLSAHKNTTPLDPDLQSLALAVQNSDFGAQAQALVLDLIRLLAQIRKQNIELAQAQANQSLEIAKEVAQAQKDQAQQSATAEMVTAGAAMAQGALDGITALGSMKASNKALKEVTQEADGMDWTRGGDRSANGEVAGPPEFTRPKNSPPAYSANPEQATSAPEAPASAAKVASKKGDDGKGVLPGDDEGAAAPAQIDHSARKRWITEEMRNRYSRLDMANRLSAAITAIVSSAMKEGAGGATISAGIHQATATIEQAAQQWISSQSNQNSDYANEMRDNIAQFINLLKDVDNARHQANQSIGQIAV